MRYGRTNSSVTFRKDICIHDPSVRSREDELVKTPVKSIPVERIVGGGEDPCI